VKLLSSYVTTVNNITDGQTVGLLIPILHYARKCFVRLNPCGNFLRCPDKNRHIHVDKQSDHSRIWESDWCQNEWP